MWRSFGVRVWGFRLGDGWKEKGMHSIEVQIQNNGILITLGSRLISIP